MTIYYPPEHILFIKVYVGGDIMATVCGVYLLSLDYRLPRGEVASFEYAKSYLLTKTDTITGSRAFCVLFPVFLFFSEGGECHHDLIYCGLY